MINKTKGSTRYRLLFFKNGAGFTIVELVVVVAIVSILAAIVLVNVIQYISRGKNASIRANLSSVVINSGVYFDTNSNFTGFCATSGFTNSQTAITNAGGSAICNATSTSMCSCSTLVGTTDTFCVDSTGTKKETSVACVTECPSISAICQ